MSSPESQRPQPFLSLRDGAFRLGDRIVFEHTTWALHRHEHWAIIGANGSGKSLLADALRGRLPLVHGELRYHFQPPPGLSPEEAISHVSFEDRKAEVHDTVVQSRWNSLEEEGALAVREFLSYERVMDINPFEVTSRHHQARPQFERRMRRAVALLQVAPLVDRALISLSNGERQKVQLARALAHPMRLLILDEPFTGLDAAARGHFHTVLERLMDTPLRVLLITTRAEDLPRHITHLVCVAGCRVVAAGRRADILASPRVRRLFSPAVGSRRRHGVLPKSYLRSWDEPFPLTPTLSPRRGSRFRRAGEGSPSSECSQTGAADSLSSGERVRVRGNCALNCIDTAKPPARKKVGRAVPSAPSEIVQFRSSRAPADTRGALETARPTHERVGQHARQSARSSSSGNQRRLPSAATHDEIPRRRADPLELVRLRNVTVRYGKTVILSGINWTIRTGESWALLGPNGSGKTTLLSLILGDNPQVYTNDAVVFGRQRGSGESIWDIKRHIGWVSPELHLHFNDSATCFEVVASGFQDTVGLFEPPSARQRTAARRWLARFQLLEFAHQPLYSLSAGLQRMVLLARALVKNPRLLILDEPCQGLDSAHRSLFVQAVDALIRAGTVTAIYVTHRHDEIPSSIKRVLRLRN